MRERFKQFPRELHEAKTLLLEFGRFAPTRRARCGQGKPQTFKFLHQLLLDGVCLMGSCLMGSGL